MTPLLFSHDVLLRRVDEPCKDLFLMTDEKQRSVSLEEELSRGFVAVDLFAQESPREV